MTGFDLVEHIGSARHRTCRTLIERSAVLPLLVTIGLNVVASPASAAPSAAVAKRCLYYAYILYPYKRPGAAPMSGDRQAYFQDCMAKNGEVLQPPGPATPPAAKPAQEPTSKPREG
jgi:hypothetical protein